MQTYRHLPTIMTLAALGAVVAATSASGASMTVMFDGNDGFGVSEVAAMDAQANGGIDIVTPEFVGEATNILSIVSQNLQIGSIDPFPPLDSGPHTAISNWQAQNESDFDLIGSTYLLFVTTDPSEAGSETIAYQDSDIGLTIDPDAGWVLVRSEDPLSGDVYYYPALQLGSLESGEITDAFALRYFIDGAMEVVGGTYVLPELRIGLGFTVVPEPSSGALITLPLLGLLASRRRAARGRG
jgi:hypothetical protein